MIAACDKFLVSPYTGEWIEIASLAHQKLSGTVSPYTGEWIEMLELNNNAFAYIGLSLHRRVD